MSSTDLQFQAGGLDWKDASFSTVIFSYSQWAGRGDDGLDRHFFTYANYVARTTYFRADPSRSRPPSRIFYRSTQRRPSSYGSGLDDPAFQILP